MIPSNTPPLSHQKVIGSDKPFRGTVITSAILVIATSIAALALDMLQNQTGRIVLMVMIALIFASLLLVFFKDMLLPTRIITPIAVFFVLTYFLIEGEGVRDSTIIGFPVIAILAGLLLGEKGAIIFGFLSTLVVATVGYAELNKYLITPVSDFINARDIGVFWVLNLSSALITAFLIRRFKQATDAAKMNEKIQVTANKELTRLKSTLEERVDERTSELESTTQELENRAQQLQAIADVAQTIALVKNLKELLPTITQQISQNFSFYHVGIFLLNETGDYAVLQAANSQGGQIMLARGHRLAVGQVGIVGGVAQDRRARIALDVGTDVAYFDNPDLPETRSEMALPLILGDKIIGVLDVQSKREAVFTEEDTKIFNTMANQVAIAIENARQAEITQAALKEAQSISRQYTHQAWTQLASTQRHHGYRYAEENVTALLLANTEKKPVESKHTISIPVQVHDEVIGFIKISRDNATKTLNAEEKELVQAVANRAALALENARLLEETSRRAGRERLVSEITTKIRSTNDPQVMIQTALNELKEALGVSKVELTPQKQKVD